MLWLWLLLVLLAILAELLTTGLVLAGVAAAALVAAGVAILVPSVVVQALAFAVGLAVYLLALRPVLTRMVGKSTRALPASADQSRLAGRRAVVLQKVDRDGGQIRVGHSEFWSARTYNDDEVISPGATVEIILLDGLTALVAPIAANEEDAHRLG